VQVGVQAAKDQHTVRSRPWWIDSCFVIAGLGCDWYLAFQWFSGRYSFFSEPVLRRFSLIVMLCAVFAFVAVWVVRRAKLRDAVGVFFAASLLTLGNMSIWWDVHR
jgi:hypothetical protein